MLSSKYHEWLQWSKHSRKTVPFVKNFKFFLGKLKNCLEQIKSINIAKELLHCRFFT